MARIWYTEGLTIAALMPWSKKEWWPTETAHVVDDVVSLWLSYPCWSRWQALLNVINIPFGVIVVGTYETDFVDEVDISKPVDTVRSSLQFV